MVSSSRDRRPRQRLAHHVHTGRLASVLTTIKTPKAATTVRGEDPKPKTAMAIVASISPVGDKDWYRLVVTSDAVVEFETSGPTGDTVIEIRSGDDVEYIGCDDDDGVGLFSLWSCCLPPGEYCVGVKDWNNNGTIGAYNLDVRDLGSCVAGEPLVCPINDPFSQCDPF